MLKEERNTKPKRMEREVNLKVQEYQMNLNKHIREYQEDVRAANADAEDRKWAIVNALKFAEGDYKKAKELADNILEYGKTNIPEYKEMETPILDSNVKIA